MTQANVLVAPIAQNNAQEIFDMDIERYNDKRLQMYGASRIFAPTKIEEMLEGIKLALWPPTHEDVTCTVWWRYSGMSGVSIITISMPYRQWMEGNTLLDSMIAQFDRDQKGKFLRNTRVKDFSNREGVTEFKIIGDPRTGRRYWNFEK